MLITDMTGNVSLIALYLSVPTLRRTIILYQSLTPWYKGGQMLFTDLIGNVSVISLYLSVSQVTEAREERRDSDGTTRVIVKVPYHYLYVCRQMVA